MKIYIKECDTTKLLSTCDVDSVGNINVGDYVQIYNPQTYDEGNYLGVVEEVKHMFSQGELRGKYEMTIYIRIEDRLQ